MKSRIIEQLGQSQLLLPSVIAEGLSANDRVKVRLSVLQAAARRARNSGEAPFDLAQECRTVGLDPVAMEALVDQANVSADERITAPGLGSLGLAIFDDVATMVRSVTAGDAPAGEASQARLSRIKPADWSAASDTVALRQIAGLARMSDAAGDTLHRLIMDLHKDLNRLAAAHAEEVVAGAHVHGLLPEDRGAVEAFMQGVEATRALKFGHPGLATTAGRSGARLTIQNDIGETDAHVVMIAVEPQSVTVTYTDVHLARAKFFTGLLGEFPVEWSGLDRKSAEALGDDATFYLVVGRYAAADDATRNAFLTAVGASLCFLIDWNKARKLLRAWVPNGDAIRILDWAARNRFGHRGFLELGGSELVAAAVHHAASARIGFGERLDYALGREPAVDFLKMVLRTSAEAMLKGGSVRLARDRIEAELVQHLQRVEAKLLAIVVRQAGLAREIAAGIARFVDAARTDGSFDRTVLAARARRIEEKADKIALEARRDIARFDADPGIERLVDRIEQTIDELEQAAFVSSLVPETVAPDLLDPLVELCAAAVAGTEAAAAGVAAAADLPERQRIDSEDALAAVGRLIEAEHRADAAERAITTTILRGEFELKTALSILELARAVERATDCLAGFGHLLRERVLADLSA